MCVQNANAWHVSGLSVTMPPHLPGTNGAIQRPSDAWWGYIGIYTPHKISLHKQFLYGIFSAVTQDRFDIVPLCTSVKIYTPKSNSWLLPWNYTGCHSTPPVTVQGYSHSTTTPVCTVPCHYHLHSASISKFIVPRLID